MVAQAATFAYFFYPAVLAALLALRRGSGLGDALGAILFGFATAGLGLLFLVGFLFLLALVGLAAAILIVLKALSACSQTSLAVCSAVAGIIAGGGFAQISLTSADMGAFTGALVGSGTGLLMWRTLSELGLVVDRGARVSAEA